jgi:chemotaxis protein methyltransferase CheR
MSSVTSIEAPEFNYLQAFMRECSAIVLDPGKEYLVESRLMPLAYSEGLRTVGELLVRLRQEKSENLRRKILDAMTNNETWFFRDFYPFEALRQEIIPALMTSRSATRSLRFWSAASSSGQEPYSIAMLLKEKFAFPNWKFSILATDICDAVRTRAAEGRYSQMEINRGLPAAMLTKYFVRSGLDWMIAPSVREMVDFRACNLAVPWPDIPKMDVVFLRNVMIYFDITIRKQILSRLRSVLQPDGVLFLGCAETTLNLDATFERIPFQKTVYYRLLK